MFWESEWNVQSAKPILKANYFHLNVVYIIIYIYIRVYIIGVQSDGYSVLNVCKRKMLEFVLIHYFSFGGVRKVIHLYCLLNFVSVV